MEEGSCPALAAPILRRSPFGLSFLVARPTLGPHSDPASLVLQVPLPDCPLRDPETALFWFVQVGCDWRGLSSP